MPRQVLVIGLGQFGLTLARSLAKQGSDVLAVDIDEAHIAEVAPHVSDAVLLDAMDEEGLASLAPDQRDVCVCAIGDDSQEASIIVTALLKQLGAKRIIARATNALHSRILHLVGADEVINPERSYGERLAIRLAWRHVVDAMPLGGDLVLTELEAPESFWGRTLVELELPRRFQVTVCAVRTPDENATRARIPDPRRPLRQGDVLMLVSSDEDARRLTERL